MMGYRAPSKKAIKDAIKGFASAGNALARQGYDLREQNPPRILDFYANVQETSLFGAEARVPGENTVVGPDAYTNRKWYATLTVDSEGMVIAIK